MGTSDSVYDSVGRWFKRVVALVVVSIVCFAVREEAYTRLLLIPCLETPVLRWIGLGLTSGALVWTALAQAQGGAWRVGIDLRHTTPLVSRGVFAYSRNPIFLGAIGALIGFFALLPNLVSLLVVVLGCVLIQVQVRLEEVFLLSAHGEAYHTYMRQVRRWV